MDRFELRRGSAEEYAYNQPHPVRKEYFRPIDRVEVLLGSDEEKEIRHEAQEPGVRSQSANVGAFHPTESLSVPNQDVVKTLPPGAASSSSQTDGSIFLPEAPIFLPEAPKLLPKAPPYFPGGPTFLPESHCDYVVKTRFSSDPLYREVKELTDKVMSDPQAATAYHSQSESHYSARAQQDSSFITNEYFPQALKTVEEIAFESNLFSFATHIGSPLMLDLSIVPGAFTTMFLIAQKNGEVFGVTPHEREGGLKIVPSYGDGDKRVKVWFTNIVNLRPKPLRAVDIAVCNAGLPPTMQQSNMPPTSTSHTFNMPPPSTSHSSNMPPPSTSRPFNMPPPSTSGFSSVLGSSSNPAPFPGTSSNSPFEQQIANYSNQCPSSRALIISQLLYSLENIRPGGKLLVYLPQGFDCWFSIDIITRLATFSEVSLLKSSRLGNCRPGFFLLADRIRSGVPDNWEWAAMIRWLTAYLWGHEKGGAGMEAYEAKSVDNLLDASGESLKECGRIIWTVQVYALRELLADSGDGATGHGEGGGENREVEENGIEDRE